ncbi:MAG: WYL domain-containing protein [Polyangiaceae bacterium]|nr:WYL domain-containing protein [Polyangiaceae bacterium]
MGRYPLGVVELQEPREAALGVGNEPVDAGGHEVLGARHGPQPARQPLTDDDSILSTPWLARWPPDEEGWRTVELALESEEVAADQLSGLGAGVEVLAPPGLRQRLHAIGAVLAARNAAC